VTTYPLPTLAAQVTDQGISAPSYADILESLKASFRSIYGSDVYLEADSQDGQLLAIFAAAINDCNAAAVAVYNAFSPGTAKGAGLASVVKINGISKLVATNSTADVRIVGQTGTVINDGQIGDENGETRWNLPAVVVIPIAGEIVVTATCADLGAISADAGTLTKILTPTFGWQTVTNDDPAVEGQPVETDAQLRIRQARSTALPSVTPLKGLDGALAAISGVTDVHVYENDTDAPDANGIPEHSVAVVIEGGDAAVIAQTIILRKTEGGHTYGTTLQNVPDAYGVPQPIRFSRPTLVDIHVEITLSVLAGYTTVIGEAIKQAVSDYINALIIGQDVITSRLYMPANLYGGEGSETFTIGADNLKIFKTGDPASEADIVIAWNQLARCSTGLVTVIVP
jgi:uncharacterized phage protein gp47/JayE